MNVYPPAVRQALQCSPWAPLPSSGLGAAARLIKCAGVVGDGVGLAITDLLAQHHVAFLSNAQLLQMLRSSHIDVETPDALRLVHRCVYGAEPGAPHPVGSAHRAGHCKAQPAAAGGASEVVDADAKRAVSGVNYRRT